MAACQRRRPWRACGHYWLWVVASGVVWGSTCIAASTAAIVSLEWPYSETVSELSNEVAQCAQVAGFQFRNNSTPTVRQLSEMCTAPSCGLVASSLMTTMFVTMDPPIDVRAAVAAYDSFARPLVDFCWYFRQPSDPCPSDPVDAFILRPEIAANVAACERVSNVSLLERNSTTLRTTISAYINYVSASDPCDHDCVVLLKRTMYLYLYMQCVAPVDDKRYSKVESWHVTCMTTLNLAVNSGYSYDPSWAIPRLPPLSEMQPVTGIETVSPGSSSSGKTPVSAGDDEEEKVPAGTTPPPPSSPPPPPVVVEDELTSLPTSTSTQPTTGTNPPIVEPRSLTNKPIKTPVVGNSTTPSAGETASPSTPNASQRANRYGSHSSMAGTTLGILVGLCAAGVVAAMLVLYVVRQRTAKGYEASRGLNSDDEESSYATIVSSPSGVSGSAAVRHEGDGYIALPANKIVPMSCLQDIQLIGSGGHGVVYLVRNTRTDELLASKRLVLAQQTDDKLNAFLTEIHLISTLQHPCVVTFVGATWTNRTDIQALFEYMSGGDLRTLLDSTPVGPWDSEKLGIAIDVADSLVYVHSMLATPIVHRDLKSRNVLLTSRDSPRRAKLSDFGVARTVSSDMSMTHGVGTSRWLAPEVILGDGDYGTPCDIYSLGVVLSELDTHRIPFSDCSSSSSTGNGNGECAESMLSEIAILSMVALEGKQPTFSPTCPERVVDLARRCLSFQPEDRPSAAAVVAELRRALEP